MLDLQNQYISGNKFKSMADCVIVYPNFRPKSEIFETIRSKSCIIYCPPKFTANLFNFVRGLKHKYILITHNHEEVMEDFVVEDFNYSRKPDNIVKWFSRDAYIKRGDLVHLPLGLFNRDDVNAPSIISKNFTTKKQCSDRMYCNFGLHKPNSEFWNKNFNPDTINITRKNYGHLTDRFLIHQTMLKKPICKWEKGTIDFEDYIEQMASHMFIASPSGFCPDCYRTWEALYLGSIPIVRKHHMYDNYPIIQVDDWSEINKKFLTNWSKKYNQFDFNYEKLSINYWKKEIENSKNLLG